MGLKTPVAFLIFNRPDTTEQVFAAIRQARPETLLVVADGPRPDRPDEEKKCAEVRAIVEQVDWPCRVLHDYSETNLGCKRRVSSGLDWVFSEVEEAIILEDDCLPHPDFFPFCEKLLEYYRNDKRVMMIGGTNFLLESPGLKESYSLSRYFPIWGWATWRRAWQQYDLDMSQWPELKNADQLHNFFSQPYIRRELIRMFNLTHQNKIDTWDIQWSYSCLFNNGLSVLPRCNLISNIGIEGTHTSGDSSYHRLKVYPLDTKNLQHPAMMYPQRSIDEVIYRRTIQPVLSTLYRALCKRLAKIVS